MSEAAPVDPTPLFEASAAGKLDVVKALVTRGHISANATRPVRVCVYVCMCMYVGSLACCCRSLSLSLTPSQIAVATPGGWRYTHHASSTPWA